MDSPDINPSAAQSPQPELNLPGPHPSPLGLRKQSHKIRKPPLAPPPPKEAQPHRRPPPPPVIIYTESPRTIHVNEDEFKSVVQRLTGLNSSSSTTYISPPSSSGVALREDDGGVLPAASTSREFLDVLSFPPIPQHSFVPSSDSDPGFSRNVNDPNSSSLISTQITNTTSPKNVDIFSTLFDL